MNRTAILLQAGSLDAMHDRQLAEHGGASGLRNEGLLDSTLECAQHVHAYGETDLCTLAAACAGGICRLAQAQSETFRQLTSPVCRSSGAPCSSIRSRSSPDSDLFGIEGRYRRNETERLTGDDETSLDPSNGSAPDNMEPAFELIAAMF